MFPLFQHSTVKKNSFPPKESIIQSCVLGLRRAADSARQPRRWRRARGAAPVRPGSVGQWTLCRRGRADLSCDPLQNIVTARPWFVPRACLSETKQKITNGATMLFYKHRRVQIFYWQNKIVWLLSILLLNCGYNTIQYSNFVSYEKNTLKQFVF